jgi:hypothetical protein
MASGDIFQLCETWDRAQFALLPSPYQDDAVPQWGVFRGVKSATLLGINPGGNSRISRNATDEILLPVWEDFQRAPTLENFLRAQEVYMEQLQRTTYWARHVEPVLQALDVRPEDVTLCNCIPFRTPDTRWSAATRGAAVRHVRQLLHAIEPSCLVTMGKMAADIAQDAGRCPDFVWNRGWHTTLNDLDRARALQAMRDYRSRL